jgi:hypothetical protein
MLKLGAEEFGIGCRDVLTVLRDEEINGKFEIVLER